MTTKNMHLSLDAQIVKRKSGSAVTARHLLADVANAVHTELQTSGTAVLPGIGTITVQHNPISGGRDPLSGAKIQRPGFKTLKFVAAKQLKEAL